MTKVDHEREQRGFALGRELEANKRLRSHLLRALTDRPEQTGIGHQAFVLNLEQSLRETDRQIRRLELTSSLLRGEDPPHIAG